MKNFTDYLQNKNLNVLMSDIAHQMVEANIDPWDFLIECYKDRPEVVIALESHKEEVMNEFWGGLQRLGGAIKSGLGVLGQGAMQAGKALGQSAAEAGRQTRAGIMGPEAHYAASLDALDKLSKELNKNQEVQAAVKTNPEVKKLVDELQKVKAYLGQKQQLVVDILKRQSGSVQTTSTPGSLGANSQQQPQQQQAGYRMAAGGPQTVPFQAPPAGGPSTPPTI
jgi:hypothetical protein